MLRDNRATETGIRVSDLRFRLRHTRMPPPLLARFMTGRGVGAGSRHSPAPIYRARSRRRNFSIYPVEVLGIGINTKRPGTLMSARCARPPSCSASASTFRGTCSPTGHRAAPAASPRGRNHQRRQDGRAAKLRDSLVGEDLSYRLGLDLPQAGMQAEHARRRPGNAPAVAGEHRQGPEMDRRFAVWRSSPAP